MNDHYRELFKKLPDPQVSKNFAEDIMMRISVRQRKRVQIRFVLFLSIFLGSLAAFFASFFNLYRQIIQSGAFHFISLFFEHFSDALISWQDFLLSLLEYLPIFSLTLFLFTVFVLLFSVRFLFKDIKKIFSHPYYLKI